MTSDTGASTSLLKPAPVPAPTRTNTSGPKSLPRGLAHARTSCAACTPPREHHHTTASTLITQYNPPQHPIRVPDWGQSAVAISLHVARGSSSPRRVVRACANAQGAAACLRPPPLEKAAWDSKTSRHTQTPPSPHTHRTQPALEHPHLAHRTTNDANKRPTPHHSTRHMHTLFLGCGPGDRRFVDEARTLKNAGPRSLVVYGVDLLSCPCMWCGWSRRSRVRLPPGVLLRKVWVKAIGWGVLLVCNDGRGRAPVAFCSDPGDHIKWAPHFTPPPPTSHPTLDLT